MSKVCLFYQHYHSCPNQTHTIYVWANPDCPFHAYPSIFASLSRLFLLTFPVYRASFPRLKRLISPTIGFLLHFPDYSVSLYTHSKDKRDFKISCLIFLDYIFTTIILCDKLFLELKKINIFQIFLFFLQVFIFFYQMIKFNFQIK